MLVTLVYIISFLVFIVNCLLQIVYMYIYVIFLVNKGNFNTNLTVCNIVFLKINVIMYIGDKNVKKIWFYIL